MHEKRRTHKWKNRFGENTVWSHKMGHVLAILISLRNTYMIYWRPDVQNKKNNTVIDYTYINWGRKSIGDLTSIPSHPRRENLTISKRIEKQETNKAYLHSGFVLSQWFVYSRASHAINTSPPPRRTESSFRTFTTPLPITFFKISFFQITVLRLTLNTLSKSCIPQDWLLFVMLSIYSSGSVAIKTSLFLRLEKRHRNLTIREDINDFLLT